MITNVRIVRGVDLVQATPEGSLDLHQGRFLLNAVAELGGTLTSNDYAILFDTRRAKSSLSMTDLWYLAAELSKRRTIFRRKIGVLCPPERLDHAAFFTMCSANRGFRVKESVCYEEVMEWLRSG